MTGRNPRGRRPPHAEIDPDVFFGDGDRRRDVRKDRQLCGQVQRALNATLTADFGDEVLNALWVAKVEPTSGLSQLRAWVVAPQGSDPQQILARLSSVAPRLRAEVAFAIHRKQVPSLSFAVCPPEEES